MIIIYKFILSLILRKRCPCESNRYLNIVNGYDCYEILLNRGDFFYLKCDEIIDDKVECKKWSDDSYNEFFEIKINEIRNYKINIVHYYFGKEFYFSGVFSFVFNYLTKYTYLKSKIYFLIESISQYFFNKKRVVSTDRIELLRIMMDDQFRSTHDGISLSGVLALVYSSRIFLHPNVNYLSNKIDLYLKSFVNTGELNLINNEYVVTGKAVATIEEYEKVELKHLDNVRQNKIMSWLTFVGIVIAIVQSNIVKLNPLFDLTGMSRLAVFLIFVVFLIVSKFVIRL